MKIPRNKYVSSIQSFLNTSSKSILLLDWPRFAGKSTLLEHVYSTDDMWTGKKYYYSFDEHIGTKQFKDTHDFMQYMQIRHGVHFEEPWVLLLNEIQYSKNMWSILHDLIKKHKIALKIIATSITQWEYKDFLQLREDDYEVITVHTLSFLEFLEYKWFHTAYINPYTFSGILAEEIQPLLQEFLNWWAYPSVILAETEEEKKSALQHIIQEIFIKDVTFWFQRDELAYFENILTIVNDQYWQIYNKLRIKNTYDIPLRTVDRYMHFLENNYIISTIKHFYSDKKREVSHKQKAMLLDMWIKNYLHNMFRRRSHDHRTMMYMTMQELYKNLPHEAEIMAYKKVNWSEIDFIISYKKNITPIVVWERDSTALPKVFEWFIKQYWNNVKQLFKTSISLSATKKYEKKEFYTIPYYLIWMIAKEM